MDIIEKIDGFLNEVETDKEQLWGKGKHSKECSMCGEPAEIHIERKGKKSSWCKKCYNNLRKDLKGKLPNMV